MNWNIKLHEFPSTLKRLIFWFIMVMFFGYGISISFLYQTTNFDSKGIEENYNGNEEDEDAEVLKFKKSSYEMKTNIHNHLFSMAVLVFIIGGFLYFTSINENLKSFLIIEPMISIIVTFGSILLMWNGHIIFKYIAMISGTLMHFSFILSLLLSLRELFFTKTKD